MLCNKYLCFCCWARWCFGCCWGFEMWAEPRQGAWGLGCCCWRSRGSSKGERVHWRCYSTHIHNTFMPSHMHTSRLVTSERMRTCNLTLPVLSQAVWMSNTQMPTAVHRWFARPLTCTNDWVRVRHAGPSRRAEKAQWGVGHGYTPDFPGSCVW